MHHMDYSKNMRSRFSLLIPGRMIVDCAFPAFDPFIKLGTFEFPQLSDFMRGDIRFLYPVSDRVLGYAQMDGCIPDSDPVFFKIHAHRFRPIT